jgi:hypothetical protein
VFDGDQDLDFLYEVEEDIRKAAALPELKDEDAKHDVGIIVKHLNDGVTKQLFEKYRKSGDVACGEYHSIILAGHAMSLGANLDNDDREYLRNLVPKVSSRYGYHLPMCDYGFREPGKVQFEMALAQYTNGEKRDFRIPA